MSIDFTEIITKLFDSYGLLGVFIALCVYYVRVIESKIDRLISLNNKTFGVMLALVDKYNRPTQQGDKND